MSEILALSNPPVPEKTEEPSVPEGYYSCTVKVALNPNVYQKRMMDIAMRQTVQAKNSLKAYIKKYDKKSADILERMVQERGGRSVFYNKVGVPRELNKAGRREIKARTKGTKGDIKKVIEADVMKTERFLMPKKTRLTDAGMVRFNEIRKELIDSGKRAEPSWKEVSNLVNQENNPLYREEVEFFFSLNEEGKKLRKEAYKEALTLFPMIFAPNGGVSGVFNHIAKGAAKGPPKTEKIAVSLAAFDDKEQARIKSIRRKDIMPASGFTEAYGDVLQGRKAALGAGKPFQIKFVKSKDARSYSFQMSSKNQISDTGICLSSGKYVNSDNMEVRFFEKSPINKDEIPAPQPIVQITKDVSGRYFLSISVQKKETPSSQSDRRSYWN